MPFSSLVHCGAVIAITFGGCSDHDTHSADTLSSDTPDNLFPDTPDTLSPDSSDTLSPDSPDTPSTPACDPATLTQPAEPIGCVGPCVCPADHACNVPLAAYGLCPGLCLRVSKPLTCEGTIRFGACLASDLRTPGYPTLELPRHTVRVVTGPDLDHPATVGETHRITLEITSKSNTPSTLPFTFEPSGAHPIAPADWIQLSSLTIPASSPLSLSLDVTANLATQFFETDLPIGTFTFDGVPFAPGFPVTFPADSELTCGGHHFPTTWDGAGPLLNHFARYDFARCCDDVFYPQANCCSDDDCTDGRCIDGLCLASTPSNPAATRLPLGHQRVRVFFIQEYGLEFPHHVNDFPDFCGDRTDELYGRLHLDDIQTWFSDLATRRLGRDTVTFDWTVTAVDLARLRELDPATVSAHDFRQTLTRHLAELGCDPLADSDLVIIVGFLEEAFQAWEQQSHGLLFGFDSQHRATARIARMLGADFDVPAYSLVNRRLPNSLVTYNHLDLRPFEEVVPCEPLPNDQLAWAYLGFSDLDLNGVIDIAEHSAFPDSLVLQNTRATLDDDTLVIDYEIAAREGKHLRRLVVTDHTLTLPDLGLTQPSTSNRRTKTARFRLTPTDLASLGANDTVTLHITARYTFNDRDWRPRTLTLDTTRTIPLTPRTPAGPLAPSPR